jgi:hypothetical protein
VALLVSHTSKVWNGKHTRLLIPTSETRVLVASSLSSSSPAAQLLSSLGGATTAIKRDTGVTEESTMGGEKETFDTSDLNASLPAAAAGKPPLRRYSIASARRP